MKVTCPKCSAEYSVQPDRIPPSGIDMKCSKCLHTFRLSPEQIRSGQQGSPEGLNIQGVTFLGGEQSSPSGLSGGGGSERYFIRRPSGKVFGPFEKRLITEMLRASKLRGDESLSRDKELWTPLASLPEFADLLDDRPAGGGDGFRDTMQGYGGVGGPAPGGGDDRDASGFVLGGKPGLGGGGGGFGSRPSLGGPAEDNMQMMGRSGFNLDQGPSGGDFDLFGGDDAELPMPAGDAELPMSAGMGAELPAPRGMGAELPMSAGMGAELPMSAGMGAELPAPRGMGAELPAPRGMGAELPRAVGGDLPVPFGGAELPMSASAGAELPAPLGGAELPAPLGGAELPAPLGELPVPFGADYPVPGGADYPVPGGSDYPVPGGSDYPVPGGADYPARGNNAELPSSVESNLPRSAGGGFGGFGDPSGDDLFKDDLADATFQADTNRASDIHWPELDSQDDGDFGFDFDEPQRAPAPQASAPRRDEMSAPLPPLPDAPPPPPEPPAAPTAQAATAQAPTQGKKAARGKKSGGGSRTLGIAIVLLVVALAGTVALIATQTDLLSGLMGDGGGGAAANGSKDGADDAIKVVKPGKSSEPTFEALRDDTYEPLESFVASTGAKLKKRKGDAGLQGQLLAATAIFLGHYPDGSKSDEFRKMAATTGEALAEGDAPESQLARGAWAAIKGDRDAAGEQLKGLTGDDDYGYVANLLMGLRSVLSNDGATAEQAAAPKGGDEDTMDFGEEEASEAGHYAEDLKFLVKAAELDGEAPAPHYFMGVLKRRSGDYKGARDSFAMALRRNRSHVPSLLGQGRLAYLSAELDEARINVMQVIEKLSKEASVRERSQAHLIRGLVHVARRESSEAIDALTEALKVDPTNTEALKELGKEFFRNRKYAEALNYFKTNKKLSKGDPEVQLSVVKSHIGLAQYDEAIKELKKGAKAFPSDARFPYYLGVIDEQGSNWFEAQQNYRKAIQINPRDIKAHVRLATLLLRDNKPEKARELLTRAEKLGATRDAELAVEVGQAYLMLGDEEKALGLFESAIARNASNLDARIKLARFYLESKDSEKAMEQLKQFMDTNTQDAQLNMLLADVLREQGQYERSIELLDRLIEADPKNARYVFKRGLAYFEWDNYETARSQFLKAYTMDTSFREAYFFVGRVDFAKHEYDQAMKVFRSVLDEDRFNGEFRFYLAYTLEMNGNLPQALEEYNQIERLAPSYGDTNPELFFRRGQILARQGSYRKAKDDLVMALKSNPEHLGALLALGDTLFDEREYTQAIELYERALKIRDTLPRAHYQVGRAHAYLKNQTEAIEAFERSIKLGLKEALAHETLGFLYRDTGNPTKAVEHFKKYLEMEPKASNKRTIVRYIKSLGGTP